MDGQTDSKYTTDSLLTLLLMFFFLRVQCDFALCIYNAFLKSGEGLFALTSIKKGDLVAAYNGIMVSIENTGELR